MRIDKSAFVTAALAAHGALGCGVVDEARKLIGKDRADAAPEAGPTVAAPPNLPPGIPSLPPEYWAMLDAGSKLGVADAGAAKPKPTPPKRKPAPQIEY